MLIWSPDFNHLWINITSVSSPEQQHCQARAWKQWVTSEVEHPLVFQQFAASWNKQKYCPEDVFFFQILY